jgi:hypothetical protein
MKLKNVLLLSFLLLVSQGARGQNYQAGTGLEWDGNEMRVLVEDLTADAGKIGLTGEQIKTKCEVRLRQAGLNPTDGGDRLLYVNVNVVGRGFNIRLAIGRPVHYATSRGTFLIVAHTWDASTAGTHIGEPKFILSQLDLLLDQFIAEFLKVNSSK